MMSDYTELVKDLHICTSGDCFGCTLRTNKVNCKDLLLASVEGVIEQLIKERDAAVADLRAFSNCDQCKHNTDENLENGFCRDCSLICRSKYQWEWRGVQEDNR